MYLILCTLFFKLNSQNTSIEYNYDSSRHYHLHTNEDKVIISLPDAIDAKLIKKSDQNSCHLNNKNIQLLYKNIQIIDNYEFTAEDYDEDTPFNFREFICMTQVKDGIIALTTDLFLYLFLFDYEAIYSTSTNNFAQIIWKADLQSLLGEEEKFEFAQITYLEQTEQALVLFKGLAYLFSVKQMKLTNESVEIESMGDWIVRDERGLTKYIEKFIFSCVGKQGIDVYQEGSRTIKFISNLNSNKLEIEDFNLKDFAIIKLDSNDFRLFCLDVKGDIIIIDVFIEDLELSFEKKFSIQSKGSGIAIDTKNGQNIFVIYQNKHVYIVNELWVPFDGSSNYLVLDSFETKYQIKDVDATDEFAILQGLSHHKILFSDRQYQHNSNFTNLPTFIQYGMRDFEFFKLVPNTSQIYIDYDEDYEPDNFFFGITANKIILSEFKVQPIQIKCFADKNFDNQYYQLIYNTSKITEIRSNLSEQITQNSFNFTVEFTTTYIFENELIKLQVLFGGLFFLILGLFLFWVYKKKQAIKLLEQQIQTHTHQKKQSEIIQQVQFQTPFAEAGNLVQRN